MSAPFGSWRSPLALLFLGSCIGPPPNSGPPPAVSLPPDLTVRQDVYAGSLLTGPLARPELADEEKNPLWIRISIHALADLPELGRPLSGTTRIVISPAHHDPIEVVAKTMFRGRVLEGDEARFFPRELISGRLGKNVLAAVHETAFVPGTTATLALEVIELDEDPENFLGEFRTLGPVRKQVVGAVFELGGEVEVAIGVEGLVPPAKATIIDADQAPKDELRPGAPTPRVEFILTGVRPEPGRVPFVALVPSPFRSGRGSGYAIVASIEEVDEDQLERYAASRADVLEVVEARSAARRAQEIMLPRSAARELAPARALEALQPTSGASLRGPLVFLADVGAANFAADLALVADEAQLVGWVQRIRQLTSQRDPSTLAPGELGWLIEQRAYVYLARNGMEAELPDHIQGILLRHVGEVGRFPSLLEETALASPDFATFLQRIAAENRTFLADSNPSARVRAHDWLTVRGLAPPGFDPMADRESRRETLRLFAEQARNPEPETTEEEDSL